MTTMASQITSLTIVCSTVYSDADQRKHQSSASLAFVWGIHQDRWIPRTKGQLRGKGFHLMTSSCIKKMCLFCSLLIRFDLWRPTKEDKPLPDEGKLIKSMNLLFLAFDQHFIIYEFTLLYWLSADVFIATKANIGKSLINIFQQIPDGMLNHLHG